MHFARRQQEMQQPNERNERPKHKPGGVLLQEWYTLAEVGSKNLRCHMVSDHSCRTLHDGIDNKASASGVCNQLRKHIAKPGKSVEMEGRNSLLKAIWHQISRSYVSMFPLRTLNLAVFETPLSRCWLEAHSATVQENRQGNSQQGASNQEHFKHDRHGSWLAGFAEGRA